MKVVFDLGNVLLNWEPQAVIASLAVCDTTEALLHEHVFSHPDWLALDQGIISEQDMIQRIIRETDLSAQEIERCLVAGRHSLQEIEQSIALLHEIHARDIPLYCLSNMSIETYTHIKDKTFFSLFTGIVVSGYEKTIKPEAEIFQRLLQRYDLRVEDLLFIDDSLPNIRTALDLGMDAVHFDRSTNCYETIRNKLDLNG